MTFGLPASAGSRSAFGHCEAGKLRFCASKSQLGNVAILTQLPAEIQLEDCHVVLLEDTAYLRSKIFLAMTMAPTFLLPTRFERPLNLRFLGKPFFFLKRRAKKTLIVNGLCLETAMQI
ncbi:MAG: hypothetical protein IJP07_05430 [Firmicutes bacterium]|nr:hypothetical protein [Bacillota bacterium]